MTLAEELWKKHRNHQDNDSFPAAMHHSFLAAIKEALERAAKECEDEIVAGENPLFNQAAQNCAARIRSLMDAQGEGQS